MNVKTLRGLLFNNVWQCTTTTIHHKWNEALLRGYYHLVPYHRYINVRGSKSKYDPEVIECLSKKIEEDSVYDDLNLASFESLLTQNQSTKEKVAQIITIYEEMKYSLDQTPTTLNETHMQHLCQLDSIASIKQELRKMRQKEFDRLLKKELKRYYQQSKEELSGSDEFNGIFDSSGNLQYGLWHNSLFTRIRKNHQTRMALDKLRNIDLYGQSLYLDCSFSQHLSYHVSSQVAHQISQLLIYNKSRLGEPFRVTLSGMDYESYLWKMLSSTYKHQLDLIEHCEESYLDLVSDKSKVIYLSSLENKYTLEYEPDAHYVMAALSERDIEPNVLMTTLKKLPIRWQGIPIDQYVLWQNGSKRLNIFTKFCILNDIRNGKSWKATLIDNIRSSKIKTQEQVVSEDRQRLAQKATRYKTKKNKNKNPLVL